MLMQLHWQFKDGKTEMRAQRDIMSREDMQKFIDETKISHPLPEKAIWMVCDDKSEQFKCVAVTTK